MKTLILAEKPELGRAIAAAVNATERERPGVIQKGDLTITWAYGHLLRLKEPEEYDPKYKQWKKEDLPIVFDEWQQVPDGEDVYKRQARKPVGCLIVSSVLSLVSCFRIRFSQNQRDWCSRSLDD